MKEGIVFFDPVFPVLELREADYNPKVLDPGARAVLRADLERFGMVEPILVNRKNNRVINGHQRLQIWREMGKATVPVNFVEVDEITEKKMNVDLNNPHIEGEWEREKLRPLLERLAGIPEYGSLELNFIGTGIVRRETVEEVSQEAGVDTKGYLKVFRLHFLPEEWNFFEQKGKEIMARENMTSYSELVLWLARKTAV